MFKSWIGIDVSKATLDVVILQNNTSKHRVFSNSEKGCLDLELWIKKQPSWDPHICMEATGQYSLLSADYFHSRNYAVSVVNPFRIKSYSKCKLIRNETDKRAAFIIADFCRTQNPQLWKPPSHEIRELQCRVRLLDTLQNLLQQERNRLKSGNPSSYVLKMHGSHVIQFEEEIQTIKNDIMAWIGGSPNLVRQKDLLVSIPGIGDLTAARLLAEIQDISNFENAPQLAAYAGVTPQTHTSGTSVCDKPYISKTGNVHLRKCLYMPAMVATRCNPIIHTFKQRLAERGKPGKVIITACMRKLLHIVFGVLKSGQPFDPDFLTKNSVQSSNSDGFPMNEKLSALIQNHSIFLSQTNLFFTTPLKPMILSRYDISRSGSPGNLAKLE